jgi:hypothetical protein
MFNMKKAVDFALGTLSYQLEFSGPHDVTHNVLGAKT